MAFSSACWLYDAGLVPYQTAWAWQKQLVTDRKNQPDRPDSLILLEHPAVYTLGQNSDRRFLKFDPDLSPYELQRHQPDLHWYLRQLEEVVIRVLAHYGLTGDRIEGLTGVWVEGQKVAAIGIKVSRWITMHGFALNVCPDLAGFAAIVPCGIGDRPVGSLIQWLPGLTVADVKPIVVQAFEQVFQLHCEARSGHPSWVNIGSGTPNSSTNPGGGAAVATRLSQHPGNHAVS
jgi:lipoyl(octanoyl) transferase